MTIEFPGNANTTYFLSNPHIYLTAFSWFDLLIYPTSCSHAVVAVVTLELALYFRCTVPPFCVLCHLFHSSARLLTEVQIYQCSKMAFPLSDFISLYLNFSHLQHKIDYRIKDLAASNIFETIRYNLLWTCKISSVEGSIMCTSLKFHSSANPKGNK